MKAIIVAAGPGKRLRPFTNDVPKCLLKIGDKTILQIIMEALRTNGVDDIVVVKGYKREAINYPNVKYYYNPKYLETNILTSLFYAESEMKNGFLFSYADIIYTADIVRKLLQNNGDITLIVDKNWAQRYESRTLHPVDEAELVFVENGKIVKISKFMNPEGTLGEFIGLAKFTEKGAENLIKNYKRLLNNSWCGYKQFHRFHDAVSIEKAYLTDMLQELIHRGYPIHPVEINGRWFEIDTPQDLQVARRMWQR